MSATPDNTLTDPERLIADLLRQLAECKAERDEALEQQTATAEVLQVINASPGDLAPVFDAILEKAHRLCGAETGSLVTYDGERFRALATHGYPEEYAAVLHQPFPASTFHRALLDGEQLVHLADTTAIEWGPGNEAFRRAIETSGAGSALLVPLRKDDALLGLISAGRKEVRAFTEKQIALLQNFAAQAVIAMENARLITKTREALEQQTATAEVLQVINSSPGDLVPVFDTILDNALRLCDATHGHVWRVEGQQAHAMASRGDARFIASMQQESPTDLRSGRPLTRLARGEDVVRLPDATKEELYRTHHAYREFIDASGIRSGVMVALRKDEALLGAIVVHRQEVLPFTDKQIALLQNFAATGNRDRSVCAATGPVARRAGGRGPVA